MPSARELGRGRFSERVLGAIDKCLELREADRVQGCAELLGLLDSEGERGEGRQKFTDADGSVWEGPLVDGQRQGHWVARRADGTVGEGPFVDGQRHGDWVWRFADGSVYDLSYMTGKWVSSVRRGVAPVASEPRPAEEPSAVPTGIGGWLAFPMLGLIMSPISIMAISLSTYVPIFSKGTWEVVTTSGSEAYHPLWAPLLIFEILGNSCLLIFSIVLIVLFFRRHYLLPKLIIIVYAASLAFQGIDFFASALISTVAKELDPGSLSRAIFWTAIWIPYFMKSQRVRNTFTNGERHGRWRSIADRGVYIAAALVILAVVVILGLIFSDPQFVKNPDRDRSPLPRTITVENSETGKVHRFPWDKDRDPTQEEIRTIIEHSSQAQTPKILLASPFRVEPEPKDARVRILNIKDRYRPGMKLPAGKYSVEVSAAGYETAVEVVNHRNAPTRRRIELMRVAEPDPVEPIVDTASFSLLPEPASARIVLLNSQESYRPGMALPPGNYRVEVSAPGYETTVERIEHGNEPTRRRVWLASRRNTGNASYFTRGSHQDDVLRLQGTPSEINRYESLGYEALVVRFQQGEDRSALQESS